MKPARRWGRASARCRRYPARAPSARRSEQRVVVEAPHAIEVERRGIECVDGGAGELAGRPSRDSAESNERSHPILSSRANARAPRSRPHHSSSLRRDASARCSVTRPSASRRSGDDSVTRRPRCSPPPGQAARRMPSRAVPNRDGVRCRVADGLVVGACRGLGSSSAFASCTFCSSFSRTLRSRASCSHDRPPSLPNTTMVRAHLRCRDATA